MLISTITFEIHNFNTNISEIFMVENTIENQEKIFTHKYTRNIKFTKTFDFQFEKDVRIPVEFIEMDIWMRLLITQPELFHTPVADKKNIGAIMAGMVAA